MVRCKSITRFSIINNSIILTQTDTTVGFLSQDAKKLYEIKSRDNSKPFIKVYKDFKTFLSLKNRVPQNKKNLIRRSKKTTFIVNNKAFRITKNKLNSQILNKLSWCYSTSANESGKNFNQEFCINKADIIIDDTNGLRENNSSSLLKLNDSKIRKLR
ncbi:MAG: Sua5/YciO/YrdC/YwlC family protein [Campylobacterota bacterium]|nr:Sua5/YciO/YrdC/YwlC family protein [Campylobacterota bacterium]